MRRIWMSLSALFLVFFLMACSNGVIDIGETHETVLSTAAEVNRKTEPPVSQQPLEMPSSSTGQIIYMPDVSVIWEKLAGCWVADGERFAYFTYADGEPAFWSGMWEEPIPFGRGAGTAASPADLGNGLYTISLTYPPISGEASDSQDLRPLVYSLALDVSDLELSGKISIKVPDDQWRQYAWGGVSYDDAYDSSHDIQYAGFEEMQALWGKLTGCWNSEDGFFVVFDQMDSNTLLFQEGVRDTGSGRGFGFFEKAMTQIDEVPLKFIIYYPAMDAETLAENWLPELFQPVYMDMTDLPGHGAFHLKIGEEGEWKRYEYAGEGMDAAIQP